MKHFKGNEYNNHSDHDDSYDGMKSIKDFQDSYVDDEFYTDDDYMSDRIRLNLPCNGHANKIGPKFKFPHFAGFKLDIIPGVGFSIDPVFKFKK